MTISRQRVALSFGALGNEVKNALLSRKRILIRGEIKFLPEVLASLTLLITSWVIPVTILIVETASLIVPPHVFTLIGYGEALEMSLFVGMIVAAEYTLLLADEFPSELQPLVRKWWRTANPINGTISLRQNNFGAA